MERKLLLINVTDFKYPPVSSAYVMRVLRDAGIYYDFVDLPKDNIALLHKVLARGDYFAAATGSLIGGYADLELVLNVIKETLPEMPTILGGRIATVCPPRLLQKLKADYLVIGDAHPTLVELSHSLVVGKDFDAQYIKGIAFRNKKAFHYTEKREQQSLDGFFPCWDDVDLTHYDYPYQYPVVTCIGCVGRCTFCAPGVGQIRLRPVMNVIEEIKEAWHKFQINRFEIISEIFYPSSKSIVEFCELLSKSAMNLSWRCNLRTDISTEVFPYMSEAGCREIIFGVESYDNSVLSGMKKLVSKETIQAAIKEANAYGIRITAGLMAGNVNDTPETLRKTADFVVDNNIIVDRPSFFTPLQIYPGTVLYAEAMQKELIDNEYEYMKDISQSLYTYINPSQKRHFLPKRFINLTVMSDSQLEHEIEYNEWVMHQNAFRNWKLQNFNGIRGTCCYCDKTFTVEKPLQTRQNAVVCPNCLSYNLISIDQTESINDSLGEVLDMLNGAGKFAFIGTRESAYWLTSFVSDNDKVDHDWEFFRHAFLNPDSKYLCGHEVEDIQKLCNYEIDNLILCDIMCHEYYLDLLAPLKQCYSSIHWIVPYNNYKQPHAYMPIYACKDELYRVAADLTVECQKVFNNRDKLVVIQSETFENAFCEVLLKSGLCITSIIEPRNLCFDSNITNLEFMRCVAPFEECPAGILIFDHDPKRQSRLASIFREKIAGNDTKVVTLNEFLFTRYTLQHKTGGTRLQ